MKNSRPKIKAVAALLLAGFLIAALPSPAAGPDPDFGIDGRVDLSSVYPKSGVHSIVTSGEWIYVGSGLGNLIQLDSTGVRNMSFAGDGMADIAPYVPLLRGAPYAAGLAVQADGKILAAGDFGERPLLSRLDTTGFPDPSFGDDGAVFNRSPGVAEASEGWLSDVEVDARGRILVTGGRPGPKRGVYWAYVRRYLPDGRIDRSFAKRGTALFKGPGRKGVDFYALELTRGGRILVVRNDPARDSAVFALAPSGRVDQRFANRRGFLRVPAAYKLEADESGRMVAFGLSFRRLSGKAGRGCVRFFAFNWAGVRSKSFGGDGTKEICQFDLRKRFASFDIDSQGIFAADYGLQGDGRVFAALYFSSFRPDGSVDAPTPRLVYLRLASNGDIDRSFGNDGLYRSQTDGSPPVVEGLSDGALATGAEPGAPGEVPDLVLYRFPGEERP